MIFPTLTAFYAGILALIFLALSLRVSQVRTRTGIITGDGDNPAVIRAMRSHANFAEYVPLILLMIALLEAGGTGRGIVRVMLIVLVIARILHPIGIEAADRSLRQIACRAPGMFATWGVLLVAAVLLLTK